MKTTTLILKQHMQGFLACNCLNITSLIVHHGKSEGKCLIDPTEVPIFEEGQSKYPVCNLKGNLIWISSCVVFNANLIIILIAVKWCNVVTTVCSGVKICLSVSCAFTDGLCQVMIPIITIWPQDTLTTFETLIPLFKQGEWCCGSYSALNWCAKRIHCITICCAC